jgi:hypothetical protein
MYDFCGFEVVASIEMGSLVEQTAFRGHFGFGQKSQHPSDLIVAMGVCGRDVSKNRRQNGCSQSFGGFVKMDKLGLQH